LQRECVWAFSAESYAFRDPILDRLMTEKTAANGVDVVRTATVVYACHSHGITEKLADKKSHKH